MGARPPEVGVSWATSSVRELVAMESISEIQRAVDRLQQRCQLRAVRRRRDASRGRSRAPRSLVRRGYARRLTVRRALDAAWLAVADPAAATVNVAGLRRLVTEAAALGPDGPSVTTRLWNAF